MTGQLADLAVWLLIGCAAGAVTVAVLAVVRWTAPYVIGLLVRMGVID